MNVAITGGTGFIGSRLARAHVARGDRVRILTRAPSRAAGSAPGAEAVIGDLTASSRSLEAFANGCDVLYHCAGEVRRAEAMHPVHVAGTSSLIAAAGNRIGHWVQLSSVGVYGPLREGLVDESRPLAPRGEYETTKAESERLVETAAASGMFSCTILRPSNVFGPGMPNRSLFRLLSVMNRGLFFFIGQPGASANYIHVSNVVDALISCGTLPAAKGRAYNLSDFRTMEQFVAAIAASLGKPPPSMRFPERPVRWLARVLGGLPGFPLSASRVDALTSRVNYSTNRIENEIGYVHRLSMEEGLRQLVASWREEK